MSKHIGETFYTSPISKEWVGLPVAFLSCFTTAEQTIIKRAELELKQLNAPDKE
jgi:hypothetical protein